jgi:hypothetical protein
LQALLVLLKRKPPKDRRLLIIATTSQREMLSSMHLDDAFDSEFQVPLITRVDTVGFILEVSDVFQTIMKYLLIFVEMLTNGNHILHFKATQYIH